MRKFLSIGALVAGLFSSGVAQSNPAEERFILGDEAVYQAQAIDPAEEQFIPRTDQPYQSQDVDSTGEYFIIPGQNQEIYPEISPKTGIKQNQNPSQEKKEIRPNCPWLEEEMNIYFGRSYLINRKKDMTGLEFSSYLTSSCDITEIPALGYNFLGGRWRLSLKLHFENTVTKTENKPGWLENYSRELENYSNDEPYYPPENIDQLFTIKNVKEINSLDFSFHIGKEFFYQKEEIGNFFMTEYASILSFMGSVKLDYIYSEDRYWNTITQSETAVPQRLSSAYGILAGISSEQRVGLNFLDGPGIYFSFTPSLGILYKFNEDKYSLVNEYFLSLGINIR